MAAKCPVLIDGVYYDSLSEASNKLEKDHRTIWRRCQSNKYSNYKYTERIIIIYEEKRCNCCKKIKKMLEFSKKCDTLDGYTTYCKKCKNKWNSNWRKRNPDIVKSMNLKHYNNIDLNSYNEMFVKQKGKCAICNKHQSEFKRSLAVDHDHKTGKIRKLLCVKCNAGLGQFNDNVSLLNSAISYLKENSNE